MRRRNLIFGLLAVATMGGARAEQSRKAHRIAYVSPSFPVEKMNEAGGDAFFRSVVQRTPSLGICRGAESFD